MLDAALEIARLRAALAASEARVETAEARTKTAESELAQARAVVSTSEAMIKHLRLEIARLRREQHGRSSERRARLIDQMELQLEEVEAAATEDERAAEKAAKTTPVAGFERRRPARKPFPDHLPRERVVIEAPTTCSCCGSDRIVKMGEDITETLEVIPRQWKVIQTVREKVPGLRPFTPQSVHRTLCRFADRRSPCRQCETISQVRRISQTSGGRLARRTAPFHPTPRGWAGPNLLALAIGLEPMAPSMARSCSKSSDSTSL